MILQGCSWSRISAKAHFALLSFSLTVSMAILSFLGIAPTGPPDHRPPPGRPAPPQKPGP
jgi:hypothetical protein